MGLLLLLFVPWYTISGINQRCPKVFLLPQCDLFISWLYEINSLIKSKSIMGATRGLEEVILYF